MHRSFAVTPRSGDLADDGIDPDEIPVDELVDPDFTDLDDPDGLLAADDAGVTMPGTLRRPGHADLQHDEELDLLDDELHHDPYDDPHEGGGHGNGNGYVRQSGRSGR